VAPDHPGSAVNLPARSLLPARRRHLGSRHPWRIRFQASTPSPQGRPAAWSVPWAKSPPTARVGPSASRWVTGCWTPCEHRRYRDVWCLHALPCRSHQPGSEAPTMACPGRDPGRQGPQAQSGV